MFSERAVQDLRAQNRGRKPVRVIRRSVAIEPEHRRRQRLNELFDRALALAERGVRDIEPSPPLVRQLRLVQRRLLSVYSRKCGGYHGKNARADFLDPIRAVPRFGLQPPVVVVLNGLIRSCRAVDFDVERRAGARELEPHTNAGPHLEEVHPVRQALAPKLVQRAVGISDRAEFAVLVQIDDEADRRDVARHKRLMLPRVDPGACPALHVEIETNRLRR